MTTIASHTAQALLSPFIMEDWQDLDARCLRHTPTGLKIFYGITRLLVVEGHPIGMVQHPDPNLLNALSAWRGPQAHTSLVEHDRRWVRAFAQHAGIDGRSWVIFPGKHVAAPRRNVPTSPDRVEILDQELVALPPYPCPKVGVFSRHWLVDYSNAPIILPAGLSFHQLLAWTRFEKFSQDYPTRNEPHSPI